MVAEPAPIQGAILHRRADLAAFSVTGGERLSWLNGLVTQDVGKLAAGHVGGDPQTPRAGAYALAVGKTGKMLAELWVVAGADRLFVILAQGRMDAIREHFDRHLIMEDAEIGAPLDRAVLFAHGPEAPAIAAAARALGGDAAMIDWTGRGDAAVLLAPEGRAEATVADLAARAAPGGVVDDPTWEATRIAWGLPRWGVDYDEQTLPQEASLEKLAVCFNKGCYLGQETVFMLEKRGHAKKKLVRLAIEGAAIAPGAPLTLPDGAEVGAVTSVTPAPGGGSLALGSLKYKLAAAGTELLAGGVPARVTGLAAEPLARR
jgi:folate-binding protein YgfZ